MNIHLKAACCMVYWVFASKSQFGGGTKGIRRLGVSAQDFSVSGDILSDRISFRIRMNGGDEYIVEAVSSSDLTTEKVKLKVWGRQFTGDVELPLPRSEYERVTNGRCNNAQFEIERRGSSEVKIDDHDTEEAPTADFQIY
ncbi:MAG: hypothetical protein UW75_C0042G0004 [Parcubacteria group bacterium GW2011_GWF2_44_8]|nr:MAG: hypothetical protein UW75_C0042G0004 [Parcubacteria group bacterium GW2011_GWF2_44_8]